MRRITASNNLTFHVSLAVTLRKQFVEALVSILGQVSLDIVWIVAGMASYCM